MNKKLVKEFLIITFVIMLIFWGGCALISQIFNLTINNIFLRIMHIIGGFSPTIASYISLKRNNKVKNLKEWLKYSEFDRLNLVVHVEWENENKNVYRLSDILPIENGFRDVITVLFDDGVEVRNFTEKIEEIIDHQIIVRGRKIVNRYDYNQKYRDKILNHKN